MLGSLSDLFLRNFLEFLLTADLFLELWNCSQDPHFKFNFNSAADQAVYVEIGALLLRRGLASLTASRVKFYFWIEQNLGPHFSVELLCSECALKSKIWNVSYLDCWVIS